VPTVKTLAKGQIVIPVHLRKKYHIQPGSLLQLLEYGGILYLIPPVADPVKAAAGSLPRRPSLAKRLLRERKKDFPCHTPIALSSPAPYGTKRIS
jgi:AbrB family looped-hinge helix DNA binding protein